MPELTGSSNPPTLEGKGNIFMQEPGNGENGKDNSQKINNEKVGSP